MSSNDSSSSPESSDAPIAMPDAHKASTADHLTSLSTSILDTVNTKNWTSPVMQQCLTPDFVSDHTATVESTGQHARLELMRNVMGPHEHYNLQIINTSAQVYEKQGIATVWILAKISNLPDDTRRESVNVFYWRRREGHWTCYKHRGFRGVAGYF